MNVSLSKGKVFLGLVIVVFLGTAKPLMAQSTLSIQQDYQKTMANYRQEFAQFGRDKQLYLKNQNEESLNLALLSAQKTFLVRKEVMIDYTLYLMNLVNDYIEDESIKNQLIQNLEQKKLLFQQTTVEFNNLTNWYQADDQFITAMATLNESAYHAFAQIYWSELESINAAYTTLYQNQNQRILKEAENQIERELKAKVLEQTQRSLKNFQNQIDLAKKNVNTVNGRESYIAVRNELNAILTEIEASMKIYAGLE